MWRLEGAQGKGGIPGTGKEVGDPPAPTVVDPHKNTKQGSTVSIHSLVCFEE